MSRNVADGLVAGYDGVVFNEYIVKRAVEEGKDLVVRGLEYVVVTNYDARGNVFEIAVAPEPETARIGVRSALVFDRVALDKSVDTVS